MQTLRRLTPPDAQSLDTENSPRPDDLSGKPERIETEVASPLRREAAPAPAAAPAAAQAPPGWDAAPEGPDFAELAPPVPFAPAPQSQKTPSQVVIEQVDVVIHEPAATAAARPSTAQDFARFARSRYLGGL